MGGNQNSIHQSENFWILREYLQKTLKFMMISEVSLIKNLRVSWDWQTLWGKNLVSVIILWFLLYEWCYTPYYQLAVEFLFLTRIDRQCHLNRME